MTVSELSHNDDSSVTPDRCNVRSAVRARRVLDVAIVVLTAPLWVPTAIGTGIAVAITSGRPVLFRQTRTGRDGTPFTMFKFRSMKTGPNPLIPTDDRLTRIGGSLRRTSLDELPQLLNVLGGSMSLVGPRPMLPEHDAHLSEEHQIRRIVRPGLTGLAQVSGRNTLEWHDRLDLDAAWVRDASVRSYARIIWRTFAVVAGRQGVDGHSSTDPFFLLTDIDQPPETSSVNPSISVLPELQETAPSETPPPEPVLPEPVRRAA